MNSDASLLVSLGIAGLAILVLVLATLAIHAAAPKGSRRAPLFALGAVVWLAATGVVATTGFFAGRGFPPPIAALVLPTFGLAFTLGLSASAALLLARHRWLCSSVFTLFGCHSSSSCTVRRWRARCRRR